LKALCCARDEKAFDKRLKQLDKILNEKAKKWLQNEMKDREKWALAFDEGRR